MSFNNTINPKTGRKIKLNSNLYNQLISQGFVKTIDGLTPPDLTDYVYSNHQKTYIKKNKKLYNTIIKDYNVETVDGKEVFKPKITDMVTGINGKKIKRNSEAYNNLIELGYNYDTEKNRLTYPIEIEIIEIKNNDLPVGIIDKINSNPNKYHHIFVEGEDYSNSLNLPKTKKEIRDWFYEEILYDGVSISQIHLYPNIKDVHFGPSYNGEKNCVITELENHYKKRDYTYDFKKLYDKFDEGVFESDFEDITKKLKMSISVIVGNKEYTYGKTRKMKAQLKLYYKNNHMTSIKTDFIDKPYEFKDNLFISDYKLSEITNIIKGKDKLYTIETDDKIYRLKTDDGIDMEKEQVFSSTTYYTKKFIESNQHIKKIPINHDNIKAIKTFINNGINYNDNSDSKSELICIDLIKAYTNFDNFPEYTGFPTDLGQCVDCNSMDKKEVIQIIHNNEGYALAEMVDLFNSNLKEDLYETTTRWVSFPFIRHRLLLDFDIQIRYMMISTDRTDLNLEIFNDAPKRALHKVFGKLINTTVNDSFTTIDPLVGINYGGSMIHECKDNNKLFLCNNYRDKISDKYYYPHITGYVQQYTEIQMEKIYLDCLSKKIKVYRIWVDGITIKKKDLPKIHDKYFNTDNSFNLFKVKPDTNQEFICRNTYIYGDNPNKYADTFNPLLTNTDKLKNNKYVLMGEAGTGKTYNVRKLYNQFNNAIILLPKHNLKKDYPGMNTETIHMFIEKKTKSYDTIIIDEFSMINQEMIDNIEQFSEKTIILVGDFGQLKCVNGTPIDTTGYNIIILEKNYRQKDKNFVELLRKTRETGDISWITQSVSKIEAVKKKFIILSSTHKEIDEINNIGDELNPNPFQGGYKIDTPIRFYQSRKDYNAGDMGTITNINEEKKELTINIGDDKNVKISVKSFTDKKTLLVKKAYSITYHAVQGQTLSQNIAINLVRLFDKNMKYVGVSRATDQDNIFILEN
jgi:hypothetical protein